LPIEPVGTKKRGFFAEHFGGAFLQTVDGRVFAVNVVADFRLGHRAAHLPGRFGYSVAS
jgi:hypothetical protein